MVLVHDLVEIDAGDTFVYDERQLVSYSGVSFQLANLRGKASWKLAPRVNFHLPLA
jgi:hypothetical protein